MSLELPGWTFLASGKVRDLYTRDHAAADDASDELLLVASDRISAYDFALEPAIPGKGALLTSLSSWWFDQLPVPNHLAPDQSTVPDEVQDRAVVARRLNMHPVECVVRGYLTGSGLVEYRATGAVCGVRLPAGLADGDRLPEPIFTPAFKAPAGQHDENITFDQVVDLVGAQTAAGLRDLSLDVFRIAAQRSAESRILLADTKFEFGDDPVTGELTLGDEVLTSDSSRYWDADEYDAGRRGISFDKQIVRDWLTAHWDRTGTPPELPPEIVARTAARYQELIDRLVP
jgi:phosphoribosylaminoimidazole-succinocarboxamide synthase